MNEARSGDEARRKEFDWGYVILLVVWLSAIIGGPFYFLGVDSPLFVFQLVGGVLTSIGGLMIFGTSSRAFGGIGVVMALLGMGAFYYVASAAHWNLEVIGLTAVTAAVVFVGTMTVAIHESMLID